MDEKTFNSLPLAQRKALQQRLIDQGLYGGSPDGRWGAGTKAAFDQEEKAKAAASERERKDQADREERSRKLKMEEETSSAAAEEKRADAARKRAAAKADEEAAARRAQYNEQATSPEGIAGTTTSWVGAPLAGIAIGRAMGQGTNALMDMAQESRNKRLAGVAADRVAGLTTRDAAQNAAKIAGAVPFENPLLRTASRMAPHMGLGAFALGKGAYTLANNDESEGFWPQTFNRAAGLGWIGAGTGLAEQGVRYAASPGVAPDAQSLAVIGSNQLRRTPAQPSSIDRGNVIDAEARPVDVPEQKALPPAQPPQDPTPKPPMRHSDRFRAAVEATGAKPGKSKSANFELLRNSITEANLPDVAETLNLPRTADKASVIQRAREIMRTPGKSGILLPFLGPAAAAAIAYMATPSDAQAATGEPSTTGQDTAITNAAGAGGLYYGANKLLQALPKAVGTAAGAGLTMLTPSVAADAYDPTQEELNRDRNIAARYLPSFLRGGYIEDAYQMAQVPERSPVNSGPRVSRLPDATPRAEVSPAPADDFEAQLADLQSILSQLHGDEEQSPVQTAADSYRAAQAPMMPSTPSFPQNRLLAGR